MHILNPADGYCWGEAPSVDWLVKQFRLTTREAEVARFLYYRRTDTEIAELLGIRPKTVGNHVRMVFLKLQVTRRVMVAPAISVSFARFSQNSE